MGTIWTSLFPEANNTLLENILGPSATLWTKLGSYSMVADGAGHLYNQNYGSDYSAELGSADSFLESEVIYEGGQYPSTTVGIAGDGTTDTSKYISVNYGVAGNWQLKRNNSVLGTVYDSWNVADTHRKYRIEQQGGTASLTVWDGSGTEVGTTSSTNFTTTGTKFLIHMYGTRSTPPNSYIDSLTVGTVSSGSSGFSDLAWAVKNSGSKDLAWADKNASSCDIAWAVQALANTSMSWAVLNSMSRDTAWSVVNQGSIDIAWAVLMSGQGSIDIAWAVLGQDSRIMAWSVQNSAGQDIGWRVMAVNSLDLAWKVLGKAQQSIGWAVMNSGDVALAWGVDSDLMPEPIKTFVAEGRNVLFSAQTRQLIFLANRR